MEFLCGGYSNSTEGGGGRGAYPMTRTHRPTPQGEGMMTIVMRGSCECIKTSTCGSVNEGRGARGEGRGARGRCGSVNVQRLMTVAARLKYAKYAGRLLPFS